MLGAMQRRKTISMAQLAKNTETIVRDIDSSGAVYRIKRPGRPRVLMMTEEYFEGWLVVAELSGNPEVREQLEQSRRDAAAGRGRTLDEIEKELGLDRPASTSRSRAASRTTRASRAKSERGHSSARRRSA
jgi:PHD/YefM family antitoxin component YafN of YafNO toxin-antitoxin module